MHYARRLVFQRNDLLTEQDSVFCCFVHDLRIPNYWVIMCGNRFGNFLWKEVNLLDGFVWKLIFPMSIIGEVLMRETNWRRQFSAHDLNACDTRRRGNWRWTLYPQIF